MANDSKNVLQRGLENIHYPFSNFIRAQTTSSLFLLFATIVALWWANSAYIGCLPDGVNFQHIVGISLIAGIGFTKSTFIATLGFDAQPEHLHNAKTSVLVASVLSAILGVLYIRIVSSDSHS